MTPRRRPPRDLRCKHCRARITFLKITFSRGPVRLPFDADPHIGGTVNTYPVFASRAWDINDLIAEVQVMRGVDVDTARDEVLDMPWHRLHRCAQGAAARRQADRDDAEGGVRS